MYKINTVRNFKRFSSNSGISAVDSTSRCESLNFFQCKMLVEKTILKTGPKSICTMAVVLLHGIKTSSVTQLNWKPCLANCMSHLTQHQNSLQKSRIKFLSCWFVKLSRIWVVARACISSICKDKIRQQGFACFDNNAQFDGFPNRILGSVFYCLMQVSTRMRLKWW